MNNRNGVIASTAFSTILSLILIFSFTAASAEQSKDDTQPCHSDQPRLEARSKELAAIVQADQDDRANWNTKTPDEMQEVVKRDVIRRKRVGEIFGEGCFSKAEDFAAAALVYQHGDVADHFLQAFIWAKRAVELGDKSQKHLMALAIDRYLVNIGHKQLFASQASKPDPKPGTCWCLEQVETSFPDSLRKNVAGKSLNEAFDWLRQLNASNTTCPNIECKKPLKDSPKGTVPGLW